MASKTCASSIRGQYYGIAAIGKIGAFVGTWVFPAIQNIMHTVKIYLYKYHLCQFCLVSFQCILTIFFVPPVGQDAINKEDRLFKEYLEENGFDIRLLGDSGVVTNIKKMKILV